MSRSGRRDSGRVHLKGRASHAPEKLEFGRFAAASIRARLSAAADADKANKMVRREGRWSTTGIPRPGTGSFHPVAIEATAEATKSLEPSV